ncbi:Uncharacterised protein [Mycobacteroides abscessus subsp. abscessus]|nr:Uncharacterised protein [Mycobacteroides abscessus subsp. abscessus]
MGGQGCDDRLGVIAAVAFVDPGGRLGEFTLRGFGRIPGDDGLDVPAGLEVGDEVGDVGLGHVVVGQPERDRRSRADGGAGEREVGAELSGGAGEQVRAADVGEEADAGLGHADLRRIGDDAVGAVPGDPDAAAHRDAVHDDDVGLRVFGDGRVHPVFAVPEPGVLVAAGDDVGVHGFDVPTGAQTAVAATGDEDERDAVVVIPGPQGIVDAGDHVEAERIDQLRSVEFDASDSAGVRGEDARLCRGLCRHISPLLCSCAR